MSVCSSMGCSSRERLSWRNKPAHLRHCLSLLSWPYMDQARSQRLPAGVTSQLRRVPQRGMHFRHPSSTNDTLSLLHSSLTSTFLRTRDKRSVLWPDGGLHGTSLAKKVPASACPPSPKPS